ncbi:MAG: class I mannose-6-phosphate isomerase [Bacteroidales bacterium]|nr:class I mannose-6-phosphate isomerase [Bacteroidales bacterium]
MQESQGLYPLKFIPILKERIWGGTWLQRLPGKGSRSKHIGESWELSGVTGDVSVVANGFLKGNDLNELVEVYMGDLVGDRVYERFGAEFPLLVKFIAAQDNLSIQVHPDDRLAAQRHNAYGKTEMWYVMEADADSRVIMGFNRPVDRETYRKAVAEKRLPDMLNVEEAKKGDVFFIPAGKVHALCKNIVVAEIQQTSDITYRIYDWDRTDASGKSREIHTEQAIDAIDYTQQTQHKVRYDSLAQTVELVKCPYFTTKLVRLRQPVEKDYQGIDSFVIFVCVAGHCMINAGDAVLPIAEGETVLLPAVLKNISLIPLKPSELLEIHID